jgi:hypothetical protein
MKEASLLLVLASIVFAQSQPPSPSPTKAGEAYKNKATPEEPKAEAGNQPASPSSADSSKRSPDTATKDQQLPTAQSSDKAPSDRWSKASTILITLFTGALAWLALLQWRAMQKQATYMRDALTETAKAADAAKDSAKAAQDSLVLTKPPKIKVRRIYLDDDTKVTGTGTFHVVNIGGTKATVTEIRIDARVFSDPLPMKHPFEDSFHEGLQMLLSPGESFTHPFNIEGGDDYQAHSNLRQNKPAEAFYVFGRITYRDDVGICRRTYFCRKHDALNKRFIKVDDEDYESED